MSTITTCVIYDTSLAADRTQKATCHRVGHTPLHHVTAGRVGGGGGGVEGEEGGETHPYRVTVGGHHTHWHRVIRV